MIVAVCGGKGGVGKSTVALNLGRELDAVVVDGDLAAGDLPPGREAVLHDVLADRVPPMEAVERVGDVQLLPRGRSLAGARAADLTALDDTLALIDRRYSNVVVDCPPGLARDVGFQLHAADVAVLVTTTERPALLDARRTQRLADDLDTPVVAVVLNRVTDDEATASDRAESEFTAPTVPVGDHPAVADAQRRALPVRDIHPECPAVEAFAQLARTVSTAAGK